MITNSDLVQKTDSKNLSLSQGNKKQNRTGELKFSGFGQRGSSNTPSVPVNTTVTPEKIHIKLGDDRIFVDYLKFFGGKVKLNSYHENLLVELFIKGKFFLNPHHKENREGLDFKCINLSSQIHEGSKIKWTKQYKNSIGVVLKIAYETFEKVNRNSCQVEELSNPNKIVAVCLEFSGTPLSFLIPRNNQVIICQMIDMMLELSKDIKVSRIDLTMEFSKEKLDLFKVRQAIDNDDVLGVEKYFSISGRDSRNLGKSCTCYFGGEKSERRTRAYDTEKKHGYVGVRLESQNRGKYARLVVAELIDMYKSAMNDADKSVHPCNDKSQKLKELATNINQFIIDYNLSRKNFTLVDKNDKKSWKNRYQVKELEFWSKFKKSFNVNELRYKFIKEDISIKRSISHAVKNFSGLLCSLFDNLGKDLFDSFMKAIILAKKKGIGLSQYTGKEDKYIELEELASSGIIGICDQSLLSIFHQLGFFSQPSHLPKKDKRTVLNDDNLRLQPRLSLGIEF